MKHRNDFHWEDRDEIIEARYVISLDSLYDSVCEIEFTPELIKSIIVTSFRRMGYLISQDIYHLYYSGCETDKQLVNILSQEMDDVLYGIVPITCEVKEVQVISKFAVLIRIVRME